ncbi:hypothetical protein D7024_09810 [Desulfofundulus salinus]|uniref:Uncharacterized protein n=1 Tax=Desulfofundulus salinus TaxID=2419843 RepID=A0A494WUU5_9FIRM|nr:hypothetical protein D7024_09810 [Desulfofundulus salinum]
MQYEPPLFRPPSEASSLILKITIGCSHNALCFLRHVQGIRAGFHCVRIMPGVCNAKISYRASCLLGNFFI